MKKLLFAIIILGAVAAFGGRAISNCFWNVCGTSSPWQCANGSGSDVATTEFQSKSPPAFLTTISDGNLLGDNTGGTVTATMHVTSTGNPVFHWWGKDTSGNPCNTPARVRFYFTSTNTRFNLADSQANEDEYWWSNVVYADITKDMSATLTATFTPENWSNPNGHQATDRLAGFQNCVRNVRQIGISFGGGCFYDIGVSVRKGTGTAVFHLDSINVQ